MKIYVALVFALHILSVQSGPWLDDIFDSGEDSGEEGVAKERGTWDKFKESFSEFVDSAVELGDEFVDSAVELGGTVVDSLKDAFSDNDPSPNPSYDVDTRNNANGFGDNPDFITLRPTSPPVVYSKNPNWNPAQRPVTPIAYVPPRKSPHNPTKNSSPQPQPTVPSRIPPKNPTLNPTAQPHDPSQMTPQTPTENPSSQPQPSIPPQIPPSLDTNCTCTPFFNCYDDETSSNLTGAVDDRTRIPAKPKSCPDPNEVCCHNLVQPSLPPTNNQSSQPQPDDPTQISPDNSTQSPSLEPQPTFPPDLSPSDVNCTCTPFFRCYDAETSSNLTGAVDDRTPTTDIQESCPDPNEVCCHNLVQPILPPTNNQSSQPQPDDPSQISPDNSTQSPSLEPQPTFPPDISPSDVNCTCTPFFSCYDEETSSNLTGVVNDRTPTTDTQGSCPEPNDVCCYNLVQPLVITTINQSSQSQPQDPSQTYPQNSTLNISQPQTQPPNPLQISPSTDSCICTPIVGCYDEEKTSNVTDVVDEINPITDRQKSCLDSNEICCHNLVDLVLAQSTVVKPHDSSEILPQNPVENQTKG